MLMDEKLVAFKMSKIIYDNKVKELFLKGSYFYLKLTTEMMSSCLETRVHFLVHKVIPNTFDQIKKLSISWEMQLHIAVNILVLYPICIRLLSYPFIIEISNL